MSSMPGAASSGSEYWEPLALDCLQRLCLLGGTELNTLCTSWARRIHQPTARAVIAWFLLSRCNDNDHSCGLLSVHRSLARLAVRSAKVPASRPRPCSAEGSKVPAPAVSKQAACIRSSPVFCRLVATIRDQSSFRPSVSV